MQDPPLVLVVDDEPSVLRLVELELRVQGFRVAATSIPDQAPALAHDRRPDVAVLDVVMPGLSGLELMARLKADLGIPVILLTAKTSSHDKVRGLELGADDYIEKPFVPEELGDRIRAALRRAATGQVADVFYDGETEVDLKRRLVSRGGHIVPLSRTEWMLLHHLASHAGAPVAASDLLTAIWGPDYADDMPFLRAWVARLLNKVEADPVAPRVIRNVDGEAYVFSIPARAPASATNSGR
ncbi:MAG: response regulator transcription factor [Gemmataceae bacterium]|nr:response regulator transcription factor [Gemmataceae bacterium]